MVSTIKTQPVKTADGRRQTAEKSKTQPPVKTKAPTKAGMERSAMTESEDRRQTADGRPQKKNAEKKPRKFPYRKVGDIEEEIFARETQIMAWNEDLLRPEVVRDSERVRLIHQEIQAEQATIAQLYEHWEEANERNG
jgi:ATP-binding cassette subfamily F protein 3